MHRLIWAFAVRIYLKTCFRMVQPILLIRKGIDQTSDAQADLGVSANGVRVVFPCGAAFINYIYSG